MTAEEWRLVLLSVAALTAVLGALGLVLVRWHTRATGFALPRRPGNGMLAASDTGAAIAMEVREPTLGLRGRPDYVIEEGTPNERRLAPVEVKPSRRSTRVYESDALQLGAYLLALRGTVGSRAANAGYVRYASGTFRIDLTPKLERRVREVVALVRRGRGASSVRRNHSIPARCAACPVRHHCDERLA